MNQAPAIREYIAKHYPCQAIPYGGLTPIALKFGVSTERVRQIANKMGATGRILSTTTEKVCPECGGAKSLQALRCKACWVSSHTLDLTCESCGAVFQRQLSDQTARTPERGYTRQGIYCSRSCSAKAQGPIMREIRSQQHWVSVHTKPLRHGTYAGYSRGCQCEPCREAARDYWRAWQKEKTTEAPEGA